MVPRCARRDAYLGCNTQALVTACKSLLVTACYVTAAVTSGCREDNALVKRRRGLPQACPLMQVECVSTPEEIS